MLTVNNHGSGLCFMITAKTADCVPPRKFIHVVIDSGAGYFFMVNACSIDISILHHFFFKREKFLFRLINNINFKLKSSYIHLHDIPSRPC